MKTIMIILLLTFAGIVNGQIESLFITNPERFTSNTDVYFVNLKPPKDIQVTIITLQDLLDYQQKCYNDSTAILHDWYEKTNGKLYSRLSPDRDESSTVYIMPDNYVGSWLVFIHKKPTFEGFLEYMKNKYKSMNNKIKYTGYGKIDITAKPSVESFISYPRNILDGISLHEEWLKTYNNYKSPLKQ